MLLLLCDEICIEHRGRTKTTYKAGAKQHAYVVYIRQSSCRPTASQLKLNALLRCYIGYALDMHDASWLHRQRRLQLMFLPVSSWTSVPTAASSSSICGVILFVNSLVSDLVSSTTDILFGRRPSTGLAFRVFVT